MSRVNTALIIDDDLGFVWWLGSVLTDLGCHSLPALNCAQALEFVATFQLSVDLLIVQPGLSGITELIKSLDKPELRIVAILENDSKLAPTHAGMPYDASIVRPRGGQPLTRREWDETLRTLLNSLSLPCVNQMVRS